MRKNISSGCIYLNILKITAVGYVLSIVYLGLKNLNLYSQFDFNKKLMF